MASEGLPIPSSVAGTAAGGPAPNASVATAPSADFLALIGQLITLPESSAGGELPGIALPEQLNSAALQATLLEGAGLDAAEDSGEDSLDEEELFDPEAFIASLGSLAVKTPAPGTPGGDGSNSGRSEIAEVSRQAAQEAATDMLNAALSETETEADQGLARTADAGTSTPAAPQLHAAAMQQSSAPAPEATVHRDMRAPVGSHAWADELGDHMTWMARNGQESASLRLNPEHLGPVEIRLSIRDGEASVWFGAANGDTRSALEQSLPRLRELFASQGLVLADAGVFREAPREQSRAVSTHLGSGTLTDDETPTANPVALSRGLIDTYA